MEPQNERRARVLTESDIETIKSIFGESLNLSVHANHHDLIDRWLKKEQRKAENWEKIKTQIGGWLIIGLLSWIGVAVWEAVKTAVHVKSGSNGGM